VEVGVWFGFFIFSSGCGGGGFIASDDAKAAAPFGAAEGRGAAAGRKLSWDEDCRQISVAGGWEERGHTEVGCGGDGLHAGRCLIRCRGREAIHKRLTELLSIGSIGVPQIGGEVLFL